MTQSRLVRPGSSCLKCSISNLAHPATDRSWKAEQQMNSRNEETNEPTTNGESIGTASPTYARRAAVANGILFVISISVSFYVYLHFPHPLVVHDDITGPSSEAVQSYLFTFTAAQAFLFAVLAYQTIFRARTLRSAMRREAWLQRNKPYLRSCYSNTLNKVVCGLFVLASAVLLCATIYHSVLLAQGGV
jgi:hypothetical protein